MSFDTRSPSGPKGSAAGPSADALISTKKTYIDPHDLPAIDRRILGRVLSYLRPYRRHAALVLGTILLSSALNLIPPVLVKRIVDRAIPQRNIPLLLIFCAGMIAAPLLAALVGVGKKYFATLVGERVVLDLRQQVFEHLHRQSLGYFVAARPGEVLSGVLNDVQGVGSVMSSTLASVAENTVVFVSTAVFLFVLDWRLALLAFSVLPLFIVPTRRVGRRRKELRHSAQGRLAELTGILAETLSVSGAQLIKVFRTERWEADRLRRKSEELLALSVQQSLVGRWFQMLTGLFETAGPALVFALGGYLIIRGHLALGTVVAFVTVLKRLYSPASDLAGVHVDLVTSYAYFERIFRVLDREPAIRDRPDARPLERVRGRIAFDDVSFSFAENEDVLEHIDLTLEPEQLVAVVGPSGAGKTTLARLIPRLYDPTGGRVLLDGHDLRTLELSSLRSHIAVVTQETYLFHGTILENLLYARPEASMEQIEAAARAAQIHELIASLPEGYDTVVGEHGLRLSGGERQRLALARVLLKDARILILDEPTSSLDATNEALIQSALIPLRRGRTTLLITHGLAAVQSADQIVLLEAGRIRERGTHDALLARNGRYARLWREHADALTASPRRDGRSSPGGRMGARAPHASG